MISDRRGQIARRVAENPLWYHTIDLPEGVSTPGWFDLRPTVDRMPWPEVRGKRCLDVGTYDGFLAFELERRGASEVVATDIPDHRSWDWPADMRANGPDASLRWRAHRRGSGSRSRTSSSDRPCRSWRSVPTTCRRIGWACSTWWSAAPSCCTSATPSRRWKQSARLRRAIPFGGADRAGSWASQSRQAGRCAQRRWFAVSVVDSQSPGHRQMLFSAGFDVQRATRPYSVRFGVAHPPRAGLPALRSAIVRRAVTGADGVPHAAVLATPRL